MHIQQPTIISDLRDPTTCTRAHQDNNIPSFADLLQDATTNETDEENNGTPNVAWCITASDAYTQQETQQDTEGINTNINTEFQHNNEDINTDLNANDHIMPSMPSSTQTCDNLSLDNTALNALLYDIKYETSPTETDVHQNKFYHWLADS